MRKIIFFLLMIINTPAYTCSCRPNSIKESFESNNFSAYGEITALKEFINEETGKKFLKGNFKPINIFKGRAPNDFYLSSPLSEHISNCDLNVKKGKYIVFSNKNYSRLSLCSLTKDLSRKSNQQVVHDLLYLKHLSDVNNGKHSIFHPILEYREFHQVMSEHVKLLSSIMLKHPNYKDITKSWPIYLYLKINSFGDVTFISFITEIKDKIIEDNLINYISTIKFRQSYKDIDFEYRFQVQPKEKISELSDH